MEIKEELSVITLADTIPKDDKANKIDCCTFLIITQYTKKQQTIKKVVIKQDLDFIDLGD